MEQTIDSAASIEQKSLVDQAIALDKRIKEDSKKLDAVKAKLTSIAFETRDNKNLKYIQIFGHTGHFNLAYKEKFEIDKYNDLVKVLGEIAKSKITRTEDVKYKPDTRFKEALIVLSKDEYSRGLELDEVLLELGLDLKQIKTAKKKLKGDYLKDKKTLESLGINGELEEELDAIRLCKNAELVNHFFGDLTSEQIETVRKAVFVEEQLATGLEYEKN